MPFLRGENPIRRTLYHLRQGKIFLRDNVGVMIAGINENLPNQKGLNDFVYWHWAQMQFNNPDTHLVKIKNMSITPYVQAFLKDGREVMIDVEGMEKDNISDLIQRTLGKTPLVRKREHLEAMKKSNPAEFGEHCERQCMCEVQSQVPCPHLVVLPEYLRGAWRWHHNVRKS